jgi:hypothetical protein
MSSIEDGAVAAVTRLAESCAGILQSSLVAAILHGSLTMDDFRPGSSDLGSLAKCQPASFGPTEPAGSRPGSD